MTRINPIYVGQNVQVRITCTDVDGAAANPTTVRFTVTDPDANEEVYNTGDPEVTTITAQTVFACTFDVPTEGLWRVKAESLASAVVIGVDRISFYVEA